MRRELRLLPTLILAAIPVSAQSWQASVTLNGGGNPTAQGEGYRHNASYRQGHFIATSLINKEAGAAWKNWYGKYASGRVDAGHGIQAGVSLFRRKDLGTGLMRSYECLDLIANRQFKLGGVKVAASASYLIPFTDASEHFLVPQVVAEVPKLGTFRGFMNYVIKQDKRFYEAEWSRKVYERNLSTKLKVRFDVMAQLDKDFRGNYVERAGATATLIGK
jgi:hypothetical protein